MIDCHRTSILLRQRRDEFLRRFPHWRPRPLHAHLDHTVASYDERDDRVFGDKTWSYSGPSDAQFVTRQAMVVDGGLLAVGAGYDFMEALSTDAARAGLVGTAMGNTAVSSVVRNRGV